MKESVGATVSILPIGRVTSQTPGSFCFNELQASFHTVLDIDWVANIALAVRAAGALLAAGALPVDAFATSLSVSSLAGGACAV
jgi:hypothetical protein